MSSEWETDDVGLAHEMRILFIFCSGKSLSSQIEEIARYCIGAMNGSQ